MKKIIYISAGVFLLIILAAGYVTDQLNPSLITANFYQFIEKYFSQWSLALSAAGTIILALMLFFNIFENRRREELQNRQAIHALHNEIHWNILSIIPLRLAISAQIKYMEEHNITPSGKTPFQILETRVFNELRSQGQLHLFENLRMDAVLCYEVIDIYNRDKRFKPNHIEILATLYERLDKLIRDLEIKFNYLPKYMKYGNAEDQKDALSQDISNENDKKTKPLELTKEEEDVMNLLTSETKPRWRRLILTLSVVLLVLSLFIAWVTYDYWVGKYGNVSHITSLLIGGQLYTLLGAALTATGASYKTTTITLMSITRVDANPNLFYELRKTSIFTQVGLYFIGFGFLVQAT